jgi:hypothetical protein
MDDELQQLQDLIVNNPELEQLEGLLDQFNIFEALGAINQEVRHSNFLAYLLNPRQNHGLGDRFVKRLLQEILSFSTHGQTITPIDLDLWDLDGIDVRREWQSIDILLVDDDHQFVVVIENKVRSGEHNEQLARYQKTVEVHFPEHKKIFVYLTADGEEASQEDYITISYELICAQVEEILTTRGRTLGPDVMVMIQHYVTMLRRFIVGESEIEKLCRQIYKKHQHALDLIYEYRSDQQEEMKEYLVGLVQYNDQLLVDGHSKSVIRFLPSEWDFPYLQQGEGWTKSKRILLFEIKNAQNSVKLFLYIGPGPREIRELLFTMAKQHEPPFQHIFTNLGAKWSSIYTRTLISTKHYENKTKEELQSTIENQWEYFLKNDLPKMDKILSVELPRIEQEWENGNL